ncbi:MAG TPA: ABC transporter permease subunit [Kribbellaceae bacterium]|nr:ABC transporter permease subunit [Kribbellaceae bacterium]
MATVAESPSRPRLRVPRLTRRTLVAGVLAAWVVLWLLLRGTNTLEIGAQQLTPLHRWLNHANDAIGAGRNTNPLFLYFFNEIRLVVDELVQLLQAFIAQPSFGRPIPVVGWLGVVAIAGYLSWVFGGFRVAVLAAAGLTFIGLQGLWDESMDTLALTLAAVLVALLLGIPLGIWAGVSDRVNRIVTPVLDLMQTMPTFVYLAPLALFFAIGPASATIATLIYAMPPAVRLTAHAIRTVPATTVEATESLGSTQRQTLTKVLLPMSKRTIVVGVNQTIMAALSMVTIAALIDAPGLGKSVIKALQTLDTGNAFNAGLAIVVLAIVLDRVTTAVSERAEVTRRSAGGLEPRLRRALLVAGGLVTLVLVWLSRTYVWAAEFPDVEIRGRSIGSHIAVATEAVVGWVLDVFGGFTYGIRDAVTNGVINPFEALLTDSPWWLVAAVVVALAAILGGTRPAVLAAICLGLLVGTGVWRDSMTTLATTLVATVLVMLLGITLGVWMGRSQRADRVIRPVLDAGQTMPPFVHLVPFLALFGVGRFTAIIAAIVYAAPVATKIVADGIRAVPATTVEAATAAGSSPAQIITKVQLPMSRRALTLATNQGLIYVLSMVVVGGLVGAGALGYDVYNGFSQANLYGKGLAAGLAIVLLGVMLDRITQAVANREGAPTGSH